MTKANGHSILYRPVGLKEMELIFNAGMRSYPPRLPEQPIFYPVTNFEYACQIARDWNTKEETQSGFVTRFLVNFDYIQNFEPQQVGGKEHTEFWVPAEDIDEFNANIFGPIEVVDAFFGKGYKGIAPNFGFLPEINDGISLLDALKSTFEYNLMDFSGSILSNAKSVFFNYLFWKQNFYTEEFAKTIDGVKKIWDLNYSSVDLPGNQRIKEKRAND